MCVFCDFSLWLMFQMCLCRSVYNTELWWTALYRWLPVPAHIPRYNRNRRLQGQRFQMQEPPCHKGWWSCTRSSGCIIILWRNSETQRPLVPRRRFVCSQGPFLKQETRGLQSQRGDAMTRIRFPYYWHFVGTNYGFTTHPTTATTTTATTTTTITTRASNTKLRWFQCC